MAGCGGKGGGDIELECKQLEGGTDLEGRKHSLQLSRGARFECERFSEFHRPPAVNNDHSLNGA